MAQMRQDASRERSGQVHVRKSREEEKPERSEEERREDELKGARVDLQGEWVVRDGRVMRQHRVPRVCLFYPANGGCPVNWGKLKCRRTTRTIIHVSGEMHDRVGDWSGGEKGGPRADVNGPFRGEWAGWSEFEVDGEEVGHGQRDTVQAYQQDACSYVLLLQCLQGTLQTE